MVDKAQKAGIKVILLAPTLIMEDATSEGNQRLKMYVAAEKQIAAEKKCQFVDLHADFLKAIKQKQPWSTGPVDHTRRRPHASAGRRHDGRRRAPRPRRAGRETSRRQDRDARKAMIPTANFRGDATAVSWRLAASFSWMPET